MTAQALTTWFNIPVNASGPNDDEVREAVLAEAAKGTAYAENRHAIVFSCPNGRILFYAAPGVPRVGEEPLVTVVDYVENGHQARTRFWMNTSSIRDLLEKRKSLPKVDFAQLME